MLSYAPKPGKLVEEVEGQLGKESERGELFRKRPKRPAALLDEYAAYLTEELGRSPRTAEHYVFCIKSLCKWAEKKPEEITSTDLRAFKREERYAPSTKQSYVVAMHSFHDWGVLEGYWQSNGIAGVKTPRVLNNPKPPIPVHLVQKLLENCQTPNEYRVAYLGLYAGCRIHESAKMSSTNWGSDRLTFIGKGQKQRIVPVHPELARVKREILSFQPASEGVLHGVWARMRKRLEIVDAEGRQAPSHALRRTFASFLYDRCDAPYEVIAAMLGHGKTVTHLYAPVKFAKMATVMASLDYYQGEPVQMTLF